MQNVYVPPAAQPVAAVPAPMIRQDPATKKAKYANIIFKLGIAEVVLGGLCCILCIGAIIAASAQGMDHYYRHYHALVYISPGLWCGIFPIISGGLGIRIRKDRSPCMYNSNMAMSIISSVFMLILLVFSIITTLLVGYVTILAPQAILCICSFITLVVCIVHSGCCCAGLCCLDQNYPGQVFYAAGQAAGQQYVQLPNGQYMVVQGQPVTGQVYPVAVAPGSVPVAAYPVAQYPTASPVTQPAPFASEPSKQEFTAEFQQHPHCAT